MTAGALIAACLLDGLLGDPRWLPHPVAMMGRAIDWYDRVVRHVARSEIAQTIAGIILAVAIPAVSAALTWAALHYASRVDATLEVILTVLIAWTTLAGRGMTDHALAVQRALRGGDLDRARRDVGLIVGRDTDDLSEREIVRATTETVAESTADGFVAPLFYLALGGPPLAMAFKAISTLDSMVGHRDPRYRHLGWASARLDDVANWIPARLTGGLFVIAAVLVTWRIDSMTRAASTMLRDHGKHPSPNSGWPEAAAAGALGVQLGGTNSYRGKAEDRPRLGTPIIQLEPVTISRALHLMWTTVVLAVGLAVSWLLL